MAYLMEIAFDNSRRLNRKTYLFEYEVGAIGRRTRLLRCP